MTPGGDSPAGPQSQCKCAILGHYLISIGFEQGYQSTEMYTFLEGAFYYQPNVRLPFDVLVKWIQMEIHLKNYEFAEECLIKPYI